MEPVYSKCVELFRCSARNETKDLLASDVPFKHDYLLTNRPAPHRTLALDKWVGEMTYRIYKGNIRFDAKEIDERLKQEISEPKMFSKAIRSLTIMTKKAFRGVMHLPRKCIRAVSLWKDSGVSSQASQDSGESELCSPPDESNTGSQSNTNTESYAGIGVDVSNGDGVHSGGDMDTRKIGDAFEESSVRDKARLVFLQEISDVFGEKGFVEMVGHGIKSWFDGE